MKRFLFILASTILVLGCQKEVYHNITISVNPAEGGSVSPASDPVPDGTSVSFKATPKGDYVFTGWSGSISGTENPKNVTVTQDMNVTANFTLRSYPLAITIEGDGTVAERIISTKSEYQSGTVVELTARPSDHWLFDHWEGDLTGSTNPIQISVSEAKSIKAVFSIKTYSYNLRIEGPGVVNESIIQTKSFNPGTIIQLVAVANDFEGAEFVGWEGDISAAENTIYVEMNSDKSIIARFKYASESGKTGVYPVPDLSRPSYELKRIYIDEDFSSFIYSAYQKLILDYNRDGILDVITACYDGLGGLKDEDRIPIRFYLGNQDGTFKCDEKNDNRITGMLHIRKMVYGDFNKDGFPDIVLAGHGYDTDPYPGEYPVILMSSPDGIYTDIRLTYLDGGFYHGTTTGDIDKDGDLDVFLIDNFGHVGFLINDGTGNFQYTQELIDASVFVSLFNTELYDIDKDGYLDLICGGHDWEDRSYYEYNDISYSNTPIVFWGDGESFATCPRTRLPETNILGYGLACDFLFYDLDKDGNEECIIARTGDGVQGIAYYAGYSIQILKREGHNFTDVTSSYIKSTSTYKARTLSEWLVKISIEESDDSKMYLCGEYDHPGHPRPEKIFELNNGELIRVAKEGGDIIRNDGLCIFSDKFIGYDYYSTPSDMAGVDLLCAEDPYSGTNCIRWKAGVAWEQCITYSNIYEFYFSELVSSNYEIEFFVKYDDENLRLCTNLETEYNGNHCAYGYSFDLPEESADGQWHKIHVPLKDFYHCDECDDSGWGNIKIFKMWVTSEDTVGSTFWLDEIRIRKIIQ